LLDSNGKLRAALAALEDGPKLILADKDEKVRTAIHESNLELSDAEGHQAIIGSTDLVTRGKGVATKTSAASVVLSDKDNKVLWKAP
jgi:hypothetical protein